MIVTDKPIIDLLQGWPHPALLPVSAIEAASSLSFSDVTLSTTALSYGPHKGPENFRQQITEWLTSFYQPTNRISAERICVTGGASQNLACILQVYSDPLYTRNIWMVSPTYFLACRNFEDNGFHGRLRSIPEDEEGLDVAYLRKEIEKSEEKAIAAGNLEATLKPPRPWRKIYRHIIYAVPTFSNPSSKSMSLHRRQELVRIARDYDALIITDDVYDHLQWPTSTKDPQVLGDHAILPRIVDIDRVIDGGTERDGADGFGNAVSNGSFSKIAGPGCRIGWAEATEKFAWGLSQVGSSSSGGGHYPHLIAIMISNLLESGALQHHILHVLQPAYARRHESMIRAIGEDLVPLGVTLPQADREIVGGYFIWLTLPSPLQAEEVAANAKKHESLIIAAGPLFSVHGDEKAVDLSSDVRVCFTWEDEAKLIEGIKRLGHVVASMQCTFSGQA